MQLPIHMAVRRWLLLCAFLVACMVAIGGLTRLTESGLSIVEWKLVAGSLPPLSTQAWEDEFRDYQTSPQFKQVNKNFKLADFQRIYWLEYIHRALGRIVGLALILPFLFFAARRMLPGWLVRRMAVACVLVAAQGTVGWVMVASGLVNEPRVNPLKLALHLSLAFALFGWLLTTYWRTRPAPRKGLPMHGAGWLLALVSVQIVLGALVAGLDAGYSYNTFPLMDGKLIPADLHLLQPWWLNHLENIRTVQFQHRLTAYAVAFFSILYIGWHWRDAHYDQRASLKWLFFAVCLQFGLGVATLLSVMNVALASLHQMGALLLFGVVLRLTWVNDGDGRVN